MTAGRILLTQPHCPNISGFTKKAESLAKQKGCEDIRPWIRSVSNHLYWCAASSAGQDGDMVVAKWQSVSRHIQNFHTGHGELFPECQHQEITGKPKWLKPRKCVVQSLQISRYSENSCKSSLVMTDNIYMAGRIFQCNCMSSKTMFLRPIFMANGVSLHMRFNCTEYTFIKV